MHEIVYIRKQKLRITKLCFRRLNQFIQSVCLNFTQSTHLTVVNRIEDVNRKSF